MNDTLEMPTRTNGRMTMSTEHHELMQQHLREENLPEAVLPACSINKVLKGQKALVTGANSGSRTRRTNGVEIDIGSKTASR